MTVYILALDSTTSMSFSKFLSFKTSRNLETTCGGEANHAETSIGLEEPADFKNEKRESDVQTIVESPREELTTVADPSLNPGTLSFEEGELFFLITGGAI